MLNPKYAVHILAFMVCWNLYLLFFKYNAIFNNCRQEKINCRWYKSHINKTKGFKLQQQIKPSEFTRIHDNNFLDNMTLVTAYFLLPPFPKGKFGQIRKPEEYLEWMRAYSWIVNPLIIYLDNVEIYYKLEDMFKHSKNKLVKLILIKRHQLWIFKQQNKIGEIFKRFNYPVHYPNTVVPAYNCVTHAKFELLKLSIEQNYYHTKYFTWIDIGYFRMEVERPFGLSLPPDFNEQKVVLSQVEEFYENLNLEEIVKLNLNWVAGGAILGRSDVLHKFCLEYLLFINQSLKRGTIGAEQQMIYAMYSGGDGGGLKRHKEDIQFCREGWFCLGDLSVSTWFRRQLKSKILK